ELHLLGLGQSLAVFYVVFLVVGLSLIVHARLGFQDLSPFLSLFSHLVALFIAGCVSGGSPFRYVCHSILFLVSNLIFGFYVVGFHSPSFSLLILCSLFFSLCSLISLHFSSTVVSLVAFHFAMFATPGLFLVSNLSFGFYVVGFHSPSLRLFFFFSCLPWY
ncbi:hypothetical protein HID58_087467, partial [Brassica napus]